LVCYVGGQGNKYSEVDFKLIKNSDIISQQFPWLVTQPVRNKHLFCTCAIQCPVRLRRLMTENLKLLVRDEAHRSPVLSHLLTCVMPYQAISLSTVITRMVLELKF